MVESNAGVLAEADDEMELEVVSVAGCGREDEAPSGSALAGGIGEGEWDVADSCDAASGGEANKGSARRLPLAGRGLGGGISRRGVQLVCAEIACPDSASRTISLPTSAAPRSRRLPSRSTDIAPSDASTFSRNGRTHALK